MPATAGPNPSGVIDQTSESPSRTDIDESDAHDPAYSSEYAPDIYHYMRQREVSLMPK